MKQFMLFSWDHYYPGGGMKDFVMSFDTWEEAHNYMINSTTLDEMCDILDLQTDIISQYVKYDGQYVFDKNLP